VSFVRTILALVVGILLAYGLPWVLERVLVESMAGRSLYTAGDYYAVRNTAGILTARLVMAVFLSVLAGHVAARVAGEDAVRTIAISAAALSIMLIWEFTGGEFAWATPIRRVSASRASSSRRSPMVRSRRFRIPRSQ
jgi:hypothetical protein